MIQHRPEHLNALTAYLASRGRHGDSILAHIGPAEANLLTKLGGSNTINPKTGLREFWEEGGGAGNSAGANSGNQGGGNAGGNGGGVSGGDSRADPGNFGGGSSGYGAAGGYSGEGRGWSNRPGGGLVGGDLSGSQSRIGESAFSSARDAYKNSIMAHIFGAKPSLTNSASYASGDWHTGLNIPGTLAGLAVGAFAPPGVGSLVGYGASELARALGIGDTVLGGPGAPPTEGMEKGFGIGTRTTGASGPIGAMASDGAAGSMDGNSGLSGPGNRFLELTPSALMAQEFLRAAQDHGNRAG